MDPKWLAVDVLSWWLLRILTKRQLVEVYGRTVYEQVGLISVDSDAETVYELNIGEILAQLTFRKGLSTASTEGVGSDDKQRCLEFWNWKHAAVERRRALGLPMPYEIV